MTTVATPRLLLRPFATGDATRVEELAGDAGVASMTGHIPHPYPAGGAALWISRTRPLVEGGLLTQCAVLRSQDGALIGCVTLRRDEPRGLEAELGYWLGRPFWGHGFATEAGCALIERVAPRWRLHSVWAGVLPHNAASARVLVKLRLRPEGAYDVLRGDPARPVRLLRYRRPVAADED